MHGFVLYRRFGKVQSLRNDRAVCMLDRYVATELGDRAWLELGRYVATEPLAGARSLRSDRAWLVRGLMAILALVCGRFGYVSVAFGQSVISASIEIRTRFYRKALRKDFFTKLTFRKKVHADFYRLSDIDSVVTDFDSNISLHASRVGLLIYSSRVGLCFSPSALKPS
ncbi:hypothetical protein DY000_02006448 [Brassica cretica]|uniref:ABC transmembrane type-1 domain-containing protein n=1 Tax=Brassica cretica TaxID=69181 RepID=A0ABQ7BYC0_BRACR|nr:hypothetical protein DY000_02006448 [Brassica cretica]